MEWNIRPSTTLNAPSHKGLSNEAQTSHEYKPALNEHTSQRFHDHFVITKNARGYYRGYDLGCVMVSIS
jgi:hypothetical protein